MDEIDELITALLIAIPLAGAVRILFCLISINSGEESDGMKKRMKHILIFIVIAECLVMVVKIISGYYSSVSWGE